MDGCCDGELCQCDCHTDPESVYHMLPCCEICPHCKARIVRGFSRAHERECEKRMREIIESFKSSQRGD